MTDPGGAEPTQSLCPGGSTADQMQPSREAVPWASGEWPSASGRAGEPGEGTGNPGAHRGQSGARGCPRLGLDEARGPPHPRPGPADAPTIPACRPCGPPEAPFPPKSPQLPKPRSQGPCLPLSSPCLTSVWGCSHLPAPQSRCAGHFLPSSGTPLGSQPPADQWSPVIGGLAAPTALGRASGTGTD